MTRFSRTLLPALAVVALAAPAAAQEIRSPMRYIEPASSFGLFAGYVFTDSELRLDSLSSVALGPQSAPIFGARYQLRLGGPLSGMVSLGVIPSKREVFLAEPNADSTAITPISTGNTVSAPVVLVETGLLFGITGPRAWNGLAPFAGVTAGVATEVGGTSEAEEDIPDGERYSFGPSIAVGVRLGTDFYLTPRAALRLELVGRLWRESAPGGFLNSRQAKVTEWNGASSVQLGAVFHP
ncbi:MAG TPA: hypothetical protein VEW03_02400 [Longimicrobiaceae bacterium]|nr:hypothetical protein [Longimicrobiaceae bacterium]